MSKHIQTLWRVGVRVRGKWEYRQNPKVERPTEAEARQVGYNVDGLRSRDEPPIVDAVRIIRIEEYVEEVIPLRGATPTRGGRA